MVNKNVAENSHIKLPLPVGPITRAVITINKNAKPANTQPMAILAIDEGSFFRFACHPQKIFTIGAIAKMMNGLKD